MNNRFKKIFENLRIVKTKDFSLHNLRVTHTHMIFNVYIEASLVDKAEIQSLVNYDDFICIIIVMLIYS